MMRIVTLSVLGFWVLMTVLLVRTIYFPDHSHYVDIPPRTVLKGFLEGGTTINTLHLYRGKNEKVGHASVSASRRWSGGVNQYRVHISGVLDKGALEMVDGQVNWRVEIILDNLDTWAGAKGQVRLGETSTVLDFEWVKEERLPRFILKQKGIVVADDTTIQPMLGAFMGPQAGGAVALPDGLGLPPGSDVESLFKIKAQEGLMMLAGQQRQAYLLELTAMDHWKAKAYFTEAGELALMDLPEGWRLVEPVIHGLVPDYPEDEELPVPPMERPAEVKNKGLPDFPISPEPGESGDQKS